MTFAARFDHADTHSAFHMVVDAIMFVPSLFVSLAKATSAAHAADRLYHLSDAELAHRGLTRDTLGNYICETYFAD